MQPGNSNSFRPNHHAQRNLNAGIFAQEYTG